MDRQIVYPGAIPLDTDLLHLQRHAMIAIGALAQAILGTNPVADGLACTPTVPASMQVVIGPGSLSGLSCSRDLGLVVVFILFKCRLIFSFFDL